jgi:hypothetical protein
VGVVPALKAAGLLRADLAPDLARHCPREEAAAHPDAPVDPPPVDRHARFRQGLLPGEHVRVHRVHQRPVEVEDEAEHHRESNPGRMKFGPPR